ncbi:cytochrome c biogenesis protein ResB [Micromonospora polyrhachis]|uniref:Cytochrome c biogenesis protein n=1 Tax=Micromonospora polyrhachis TaxID=1282883 RepID=A0A7W7SQC2_9ACTN|nr:cytochrome c biogenesis protein ResB [Micromonospora polyrhachis]MBB4958631.1 cytochrome c biogenesis protein [Micromonospora polyrhachis]
MTAVADRAADPKPPSSRRPNRLLALLRNSWRQLTSMRTALVLLFLLAVAAIPGSVLPQRGVNRERVDAYFVEHPKLAPVLDRLGAFEVYASIWFSAIYLLLFTSLVGCILPRLRDHIRAIRTAPPAAPKRLDRLPQHTVLTIEDAVAEDDGTTGAGTGRAGTAQAIAAMLRQRRWRVVVRDDTVSAEKGHLKETGNLLFHLSLVVVLVGVGYGSWYGWHGNRLLVAGSDKTFCNTLQQYAETGLGPRVDAADLPPFCLELTDFQATFLESGQPESYRATVNVDEDGGATRSETFSVNSPLRLDGANAYLLGHGYAPIIRYTDRNGQSQTNIDPFLNIDGNMTSEGVALFPDVNLTPTGERNLDLQVAFEGLYLPTAPESAPFTRSQYPAERSPALMLFAYRGNLGLEAGIPGSVYKLDQRQVRTGKLKQVGEAKLLRLGEKWTLDDGTTVEFLGTRQFVTISVRHDPGELIVLVSSGLMLVGLMLSLTGRRRRVWFRVTPAAATAGSAPDGGPKVPISAPTAESTTSGSSLIEAGGLPRTDYSGFADEFEQLVAEVERGVRVREGTE